MSYLWKKIRSQSDDKLSKYLKNESGTQMKKSHTYSEDLLYLKVSLIKSSDEDIFFNEGNDANIKGCIEDKTQLIRDLQGILCNEKACSYFLNFLHNINEEKNIFFLKDCVIYEDSVKLRDEGETESINKCSLPETECSVKLPDLVCNIPQNAISSPLPSPEEVETLTVSDSVYKTEDSFVLKDSIHTNTFKNCSVNKSEGLVCQLANNIVKVYFEMHGDKTTKLKLNPESINNVLSKLANGELDKELFYASKQEIMCLLKNRFVVQYLDSEYFLQHQVDIFTGNTLALHDILNCDITFLYFMQFMEQENAQILLEFWLSVTSFKNQISSISSKNSDQLQCDAMILYDKYFSMQATCPLGFGHRVRAAVEENICKEVGPDSSCFDLPFSIVFNVLQRDYFKSYLSSSIHIKCLGEMINSVKFASKTHKRSGSSCSSENSLSTNKCTNTLLAMDTSSRALTQFSESSNLMTIDSRHILDPDSLWRRKNFRKLSCGYIDKMGRFEAEISPEPLKEESKFTQKIKKIIKYEESKIKEEMAYKVAEMIIKDVMNTTSLQEMIPIEAQDR